MTNRMRYIGVHRGANQECNPELWVAVIHQALSDLVSTNKIYREDKRACKRWFFTPNRDFVIICDLAGLHPDVVRKFALAVQADPELLKKVATK